MKAKFWTEERLKMVDEMIRQYEKMVVYLYSRWSCESKYEDFKDYENHMKEKVGASFVKATKKPFGFIMSIENAPHDVQVFVNSSAYGWKGVSKRS